MKLLHHVRLTVYIKPEDDAEAVKTAFLALLPWNPEEKKCKVLETNADIEEGRNITILQLNLEKVKHTLEFVNHLKKLLNEDQKQLILKQKESRLDAGNHFFLRIDKTKWLARELWITDGGDCFHIRITIAAFPGTRKNAMNVVHTLFAPLT